MTTRETFLQRVRQAVTEGNRSGAAAPLPERGSVGIGFVEGDDAVVRFCKELAVAGGKGYVVAQPAEAIAQALRIIDDKKARQILLAPSLPELELAPTLRDHGLTVTRIEELTSANCRDPFFRADLGISGTTHLIAETGSLALAAGLREPRSVSLLPPVHVVLAHRRQILLDLFDLFALYGEKAELPSCLTLVTGPSKTGDIELKLVTGVHGPGEVHVIIGTWE